MQLPSNLLIAKTRPSRIIPTVMCLWGIANACTGATKNFATIMIVRVILAFCEAPFFPAAIYMLSCFYTKTEIAKRISIMYSASLFSGAISGLLATAITSGMDGKAGLPAWRWLFIIEVSRPSHKLQHTAH
jgi:MFS family permease